MKFLTDLLLLSTLVQSRTSSLLVREKIAEIDSNKSKVPRHLSLGGELSTAIPVGLASGGVALWNTMPDAEVDTRTRRYKRQLRFDKTLIKERMLDNNDLVDQIEEQIDDADTILKDLESRASQNIAIVKNAIENDFNMYSEDFLISNLTSPIIKQNV